MGKFDLSNNRVDRYLIYPITVSFLLKIIYVSITGLILKLCNYLAETKKVDASADFPMNETYGFKAALVKVISLFIRHQLTN